MTMVATDSYRLAVKRTELEADLGGELEANIPARALRELSRILSAEGAEEAAISLLTNQAVFEAGSITLTTRLIEGQFPNFRQLLPESYEHDVRLVRPDFLDVVRRVSQLAQRNAPLRLSFTSGELTVAAETPDVGDATETMPAAFEGEPLEIGFNPEFLREGIESVEGDEILLRLISPLRPGLLQPVEGDDFRYLVMPIRLNV
jgi:DNA polymerase-3 subunit beta